LPISLLKVIAYFPSFLNIASKLSHYNAFGLKVITEYCYCAGVSTNMWQSMQRALHRYGHLVRWEREKVLSKIQ
jgi:hypothetical protein